MSKDALYDSRSMNQEPSAADGAVEVLMRLPDVRAAQGGESRSARSPGSPERKTTSPSAKAGSSAGSLLDSVRHKWSSWKNAAMFAQVGVSSRLIIVGGLVLGMVIAAYVLVDRKEEGVQSKYEQYRASREKTAPSARESGTPVEPVLPEGGAAVSPANLARQEPVTEAPAAKSTWTPVDPPAATARQAPRARLELEPSADQVPAKRTVDRRAIEQPPVRSADARSRSQYERPNSSPNAVRYDGGADRYRDSAQADDPYAPTRIGARNDGGYRQPAERNGRVGAGFRGTIEPVPYRNER